jgi:hypothetical protein
MAIKPSSVVSDGAPFILENPPSDDCLDAIYDLADSRFVGNESKMYSAAIA